MGYCEMRKLSIAGLAGVTWLTACGPSNADSEFAPLPELTLTEQLRIGSLDDPETALTYVRALAVGPAGQIYSMYPQESLIRIHDASGNLVAHVGGRGEGPGEFSRPGVMGILVDTLWVHDHGLYRLSFFDLTGELLKTKQLEVDLGSREDPTPPRPIGLLPNGDMLAQSPAFSRDIASGELRESAFLRWDRGGNLIDTIVSYPVENTVWEIRGEGDPPQWMSYTSQPLADATIAQLSSHRPQVVIAERAAAHSPDDASFRITLRTYDADTAFSTEFRYVPLPVAQGLVDSLVDMRAEALSRGPLPGAPSKAKAVDLATESLYRPSYHPPVSLVLLSKDGSVWIRRELVSDSVATWWRVEDDGQLSGELSAPTSLVPMVADRMTWWAVEYDEYDVPYIVRLSISEP